MLIVDSDRVAVEQCLAAGELACPACSGVLGPWGWAKERAIRDRGDEKRLCVRRSRCRTCGTTHVLLPDTLLLRRRDSAATIVGALADKARRLPTARITAAIGVPFDTVRGWFRRVARHAELLRAHLVARAHALDPALPAIAPAGGGFADAVEALGICMRAATRRFGPRPGAGWASALTGGLLLVNTSSPWSKP